MTNLTLKGGQTAVINNAGVEHCGLIWEHSHQDQSS